MNNYALRYNSPTPEDLRELSEISERRYVPREFLADPTFSIWLGASKLTPNHEITMRDSRDGWGRDMRGLYDRGYWKFTFPSDEYGGGMEYKFLLDGEHRMKESNFRHPGPNVKFVPDLFVSFPAPDAADPGPPLTQTAPLPVQYVQNGFHIWFRTDRYPGRVITLRNNVDGWNNNLQGAYEDGYWKFSFPADPRYANGIAFKFLLDGTNWMEGDNLTFPGRSVLIHEEHEATFGPHTERFRHAFDRLVVQESVKQQTYIRNHYDESYLFDVIVIGSGMGGGILADALSDAGLDTLVLEAGSLTHESHTYNLPTGEVGPEGARYRVGHYRNHDPKNTGFGDEVTMNFGGRSIFWSGVIPTMQTHELKRWPDVLGEYLTSTGYKNAERLMRKFVTFGDFEDRVVDAVSKAFPQWNVVHTPRADHQPEFRPNGTPRPSSFIVRSSGTFSTADLLLDSLSTRGKGGAENLYINANHLVTRLERSNNEITGVICEDLVGCTTRRFKARAYVLAAGSMESVRIALNSGLDTDHPLIGRGFSDHPSFFVGYDGKDIFLPPTSKWFGPRDHARIYFYPTEASPSDLPCNIEVNINGRFWIERHSDDDILENRINSSDKTTINLKFTLPYALEESNFIRLGTDGKLDVHVARMREDPVLRPAVLNMSKQILEFFGVKITDLKEFNDRFVGFGNGGTPHHAGGSMRLGASGQSRVVDTDLKFEHLDNLYACDPSVYPMIPAANPSLTLGALALRLGDHLHRKLRP